MACMCGSDTSIDDIHCNTPSPVTVTVPYTASFCLIFCSHLLCVVVVVFSFDEYLS